MNETAKLEAKVQAVNQANAYAEQLRQQVVAIFRPFLGQQITKKDHSLLAKLQKLMPELPYRGSPAHGGHEFLHVYRTNGEYNLAFHVSAEVTVAGERQRYDNTYYFGTIDKNVLTALEEQPLADNNYYRTDFTAAEIKQKQEALSNAENAVKNAYNALGPFRN